MEHLIPESLVAGLPQWALLAITAVAIFVLIKGADWLVDAAASLARRAGIAPVIVGATVVSIGTTSPEAAVSVMAAWAGQPGLALGNAIGSVIADTALIFGVCCLLVELPADRFILSRQGWVQAGSAALLGAVCYGAYAASGDEAAIGRWVGVAFLALLAGYLYLSVYWNKQHPTPEVEDDVAAHAAHTDTAIPLLLLLGLAGIIVVILSSRVLILSVSELAAVHWHVPEVVIAGTLVALGTSLPEFVVGLTSVRRRQYGLLVGNVIGADVLNVLFVIGASAAAAPLPIIDKASDIPAIALLLHLPAMLLILAMFRVWIAMACRRGRFSRWMGIPLVASYVLYTATQYLL